MDTFKQPTTGGTGGPSEHTAELLDVRRTAQLLGCATRTVYRLSDSGKMPRPVRLGSLVRWRADELRRWIDAGCPAVRSMKRGAR
jgi:excisionase family DNA binding protein